MGIFDDKLEKPSEDPKRLTLAEEHRAMIDDITKVVGKTLEINHITLRGLVWKALKKMQVDNDITTKEVAKLPPDGREKYTLIAFKNLKKLLFNIHHEPEDEQKINDAIDRGIAHYRSTYMNR